MKIVSELENYLEIKTSDGFVTKISKIDKKYCDDFPSWRIWGRYVRVTRYVKTEYGFAREDYYLHRLIMNKQKGFTVDHKNRDKLDNRRENLRLVTRSENGQNKAKAKGLTSIYRGVGHRPRSNKKNPWVAYISKDGIRYDLGYFNNEIDAAKAYDKKALELYGQHAYFNLRDQI